MYKIKATKIGGSTTNYEASTLREAKSIAFRQANALRPFGCYTRPVWCKGQFNWDASDASIVGGYDASSADLSHTFAHVVVYRESFN